MNKKYLLPLGIIAVLIIGAAMYASNIKRPNKVVTNAGPYCSTDGTFSDTKPIQSHRSYCLKSDSSGKTYSTKTANEYTFSIVDDKGTILKDFAITHTKPMHVIVVRKDLVNFQHVHPEYDASTGTFTLKDVTFQSDGEYRIFADFAPNGGQKDSMGMPLGVTTSEDVSVGDMTNYKPQSIGTEEKTKTFDGLRVTLNTRGTPASGTESMLLYSLTQNGKPVTDLEPYLGALGHAVILREGTLDFIHAHPVQDVTAQQNGRVSFMVNFPQAGTYKVFTQFQKDGHVITTDFVISVDQGSVPALSQPGAMHTMPDGTMMHN